MLTWMFFEGVVDVRTVWSEILRRKDKEGRWKEHVKIRVYSQLILPCWTPKKQTTYFIV